MINNKKQWDDVFRKEGHVFDVPHEDVVKLIADLQAPHAKRVLDLGSGTGRHIVHMAKQGFQAYGLDNSKHGIDLTKRWLDDENLTAELYFGDMTKGLPYEDNFFDAMISIQVIHHARLEIIEFMIEETSRVLKPNGTILITVPATKSQAKTYKQIEPNTYIPLDGIEKGLTHYYFDEVQLRKSLHQFDILSIHIDEVAHFVVRATLRNAIAE